MAANWLFECSRLHGQHACPRAGEPLDNVFMALCQKAYESINQDKYSKPMFWIGIYIAVASFLCTLAMGADLLHGFRNKKLWFPCKYFTINGASLMVIAIAMKLPVDISSPMPGRVDKVAKHGSIMFMCTMMLNLMPSLAGMSYKDLLTNFVALVILIVTIAVNVCIQIGTGVISFSSYFNLQYRKGDYYLNEAKDLKIIATIYVALLLLLLVISTSSVLAIPTSKRILESKYTVAHRTASNEVQEPWQSTEVSTLEKLSQHVTRYWVMAQTSSPQYVTATSPTCSASVVICVPIAVFHLFLAGISIYGGSKVWDTDSDYRWSTSVILVIQAIGVAVGSIAPLFRYSTAIGSIAPLFRCSINHIKVFRVESYWTQKLSDWKQSYLPFPIAGSRCKLLVYHVKNQILSCCIGLQKAVVVACKVIGLLPIFFKIFCVCCPCGYKHMKRLLFGEPVATSTLRNELSCYALQLNDDVEIAERTLKGISESLNHLMNKAEKKKPNNLLKFLERPIRFEGLEQLDSNHVSFLLTEEPLNCWSLLVISLTSIAIAIPNIPKATIHSLLRRVDESLVYAFLVEESLNTANDSVNFQRAAKKLWLEVGEYRKWLNNNLQGDAFNGKTSEETLKLLMDRANDIIEKLKREEVAPNEISFDRTAADSIYRITNEILLSCQGIPEPISEEQLFMQLSTMIADVLYACFTNLPQVIAMKCYASTIEKREESVKAAAQLLGQTKEIINKLQAGELLRMEPNQNGIC